MSSPFCRFIYLIDIFMSYRVELIVGTGLRGLLPESKSSLSIHLFRSSFTYAPSNVPRYNGLIFRFMTIERPDLRRDNHDLLRKVQEVWQVIEHGSMMPKVKVVSTSTHLYLLPLSSGLIEWIKGRKIKREMGRKRKKEKPADDRKNPQQPTPSVSKFVNSNQKSLRRMED